MKKNRHEKILDILETQEIETQEELASALRKSGYDVTQATVSRDIRALGLTKIPGSNGRQKYALVHAGSTASDKYVRVLRDSLISMDQAQNILVIKTVSGMAMAAAAALDAIQFPEIVGCIAGDDTIMAAIKSADETKVVIEKIRNMVGLY